VDPEHPFILYDGSGLLFSLCSMAEDSTAKGMDWALKEKRLRLEVGGLRHESIVHCSSFIVHRPSSIVHRSLFIVYSLRLRIDG